jgi:hypothetical protein
MAVTVASAILAFLKVALFRELLVGSSLKASSARFTAKTNSSFRRRNSSVASGVIIHSIWCPAATAARLAPRSDRLEQPFGRQCACEKKRRLLEAGIIERCVGQH